MCELEDFLRRADENRAFAVDHCLSNDDVWAVVVFGYAAILLVNAIVIKFKGEPKNHDERWRLLNELAKGLPQLKKIRTPYNYIFRRCWSARYRPNCIFSEEEMKTIQENLATIENIIKPLVRARV